MENKKKLVMFDFDGVLIDTLPIVYDINTEINENLSLEEYRGFFNGNIYSAFRKDGTPKKSHPKFHDLYDERSRELKIPEVLKDSVKKLSEKYNLSIISSTGTDSIKTILEREGVLKCFSDILGADFATSKIKKIKFILEKYSGDPQESVFITDTVGDLKEARECGVPVVCVTWGFHDKKELANAKPEVLIDEFEKLYDSIEELLK